MSPATHPAAERGRELDAYRKAQIGLAALCLAFGVTSAAELQLFTLRTPMPWSQALAIAMPRWMLIAACVPVLMRLAHHVPLIPATTRSVGTHAAAFTVLAVGSAIVYTISSRTFGPGRSLYTVPVHTARSFVSAIPIAVLIYGTAVWVARSLDLAAYTRARDASAARLESQLGAARLALLRGQLRPHFLHNALHAIAALIAESDQEAALSAVEQLAELLHATMRDTDRQLVPLREELDLAGRYVAIQRMRFGDRLSVDMAVPPALDDALVPPFILQPLLENAIQHGASPTGEPTRVTVRSAAHGESVILSVENDGAILPVEWAPDADRGIGLPNIRARLAELYGSAATLRVAPRREGGVVAEIRVPMRRPSATPVAEAVA